MKYNVCFCTNIIKMNDIYCYLALALALSLSFFSVMSADSFWLVNLPFFSHLSAYSHYVHILHIGCYKAFPETLICARSIKKDLLLLFVHGHIFDLRWLTCNLMWYFPTEHRSHSTMIKVAPMNSLLYGSYHAEGNTLQSTVMDR